MLFFEGTVIVDLKKYRPLIDKLIAVGEEYAKGTADIVWDDAIAATVRAWFEVLFAEDAEPDAIVKFLKGKMPKGLSPNVLKILEILRTILAIFVTSDSAVTDETRVKVKAASKANGGGKAKCGPYGEPTTLEQFQLAEMDLLAGMQRLATAKLSLICAMTSYCDSLTGPV